MANAYRIKITKAPDWERVADRLDDELELAMTRIALWLGSRSAEKATVDTGRLRKSVQGKYRKEGTKHIGLIGSGLDYAAHVHEGTRPHFPPPAALKEWAARVLGDEKLAFVVARAIARRGTKATPFIRDTLEEKKDYVRRQITRAVRRAWDEPGGTSEGE